MAILYNKVTAPSDINIKPAKLKKSADSKSLKVVTPGAQQKTIHPGLKSKVT